MSTLGMEPVGLHCNHSELLPAQLEDQCPNPSTSFHASLQKRHLHSTISGLSIVGGCLSVHVIFPRFFFKKTHDFMLLFMQYLHPMHSDLIIFHCELDEKTSCCAISIKRPQLLGFSTGSQSESAEVVVVQSTTALAAALHISAVVYRLAAPKTLGKGLTPGCCPWWFIWATRTLFAAAPSLILEHYALPREG